MQRNIQRILNILGLGVTVAVLGLLGVRLYQALSSEEGLSVLLDRIRGTGISGMLILTLIQAMQVLVAFIPGEVVELASGAMFGIWGLIPCLLGLNLGTVAIFLLVRRFSKGVVYQKFRIPAALDDPNRALLILFFLFLIPGIPKDVLIYPVPLTKVSMWKFLIVSSVARIPSVLSSVFIGASLMQQNYVSACIVFFACLIPAVLGLCFNKRIYEWISKKQEKQ